MHPPPFRLGDWLVRPDANELERDGEVTRVEPKVMEVLVVLAAAEGRTLSRDELHAAAWPGVVVSDDALNATVSKLRRALGDDPRDPRYVETVPRRGYRLLETARPLALPPPRASRPPAPTVLPSPRRSGLGWLGAGAALVALLVAPVLLWLRPEAPAPVWTARPLTAAPGLERDAARAPDGRLAYAARARDGDRYHLWVQDTSGARLQVTDAPEDDRHPVWEGDALVFLRCSGTACGVYRVSALGGPVRRVSPAAVTPYGLSRARDGALAVVARDTAGTPAVGLLTPGAEAVRLLAPTPAGSSGAFRPAFAPDGRRLAFSRHDRAGGEDVWVHDLDAGTEQRLTDIGAQITGIAWAEDGLWVTAARAGAAELLRAPLGGGEPEAIPVGVREVRGVTASNHGLVVEAWSVEVNLWVADIGADTLGPLRPAIVSTAADHQPALSPDGRRLAWVSERDGAPALWVAGLDAPRAAPLRLTEPGVRVGAPAWAPDGARIAYEVQHEGAADLYVVPSEGGPPQPVAPGRGYDAAPRWNPTGDTLYFGSERGGDWQVWRAALGGGAPEPVTTRGGLAAEPGPGGVLYLSRYREGGLWRHGARADSLLVPGFAGADWGNWAATERGLFFVQRGEAGDRLMLLRPDGARQDFGPIPAPLSREPGVAVSRDGRRFALARVERIEADLVGLERTR